jgi:FkbM family methyltransferase
VGANYGSKSEVFLRLGAKVVAFEPQLDCLCELKARLGPHPKLTTVNAAVGSRAGRSTFYVGPHRTSSSLLQDWQQEIESTVEVPVTTLDAAIAQYGLPDYCKIDVEGYEVQVLQGLTRPIPLLSLEYHLRRDGTQQMIECLNYLSRLGDIRLNITPAETPEFGLPTWYDMAKFIEFFVHEVPGLKGYSYGDIFVQTAA